MRYILFMILISTAFSCDGVKRIGFTSPLPPNGKQCPSIEKKLMGNYKFNDPQLVLLTLRDTLRFVNQKEIKSNINNKIQFTRDSINTVLHGEYLICKDSMERHDYNVMIKNLDSLILSYAPYRYYKKIDSTDRIIKIILDISSNLFIISDSTIIKKQKGCYYFNSCLSSIKGWDCFQVDYRPRHHLLSINTFTEEDHALLNRLMKLYGGISDSAYFPSKRAFRKFLKLNGFEKKMELTKE